MLRSYFRQGKGNKVNSTYRGILAEVLNAEELEEMRGAYLSVKKYFGKQVLVAIDGKVLRGTLYKL
jgi:hypothetical protein